MWIQFTTRYCWEATTAVNIVFKPDGGPLNDGRYQVTRECAEAAIAAGKATKAVRPKGRF
jgi:hypothetical protein